MNESPTAGEGRSVEPGPELAAEIARFLREDLLALDSERMRYLARVAANLAEVLGRELELGAARRRAHERRLGTLGVKDDVALAEAIRNGRLDGRLDDVMAAVQADVKERLRIVNPRWMEESVSE